MSAALEKAVATQGQQIETLTKSVGAVINHLKSSPKPGTAKPSEVFGLPNVRTGENPLTSRGLSFQKMLGLISGAVAPDQAKVEIDTHNRLHTCYKENYTYGGGYRPGEKSFLMPLSTSLMQQEVVPRDFRREMKAMVQEGVAGADWDEMRHYRRQEIQRMGYDAKTLSWINELSGGALVAPPEFGEIIELLRAKEALVNAGARVVPLPPQGRIKYPRHTQASLGYWLGENAGITDSNVGTGEMTLTAKKLAVLIKTPNELMRFASPATEALIRDDMTKTMALTLDLACLEGVGSDYTPLGLTNNPGITTIASSSPANDGDRLVGEDIYRMITAVEEANAEFEGFIMRPKTWYKYMQLRADAVVQGDRQGMFLFNLIREAGDGVPKPALAGYPVTKSTLISQSRAKGSSTDLTYIVGGMWSDALIGMFGAIEFAATNVGDTPFVYDQTWVRGILSADFGLRRESAFVLMDDLSLTA